MASVNRSGVPPGSALFVVFSVKESRDPGVKFSMYSLKKTVSFNVTPAVRPPEAPPVAVPEPNALPPAPKAKLVSVTTLLFRSPGVPLPSKNCKSSLNGPLPVSGLVFSVTV